MPQRDLSESELYSVAALYTLALHLTQVRVVSLCVGGGDGRDTEAAPLLLNAPQFSLPPPDPCLTYLPTHTTQVEDGRHGDIATAWGEPPDDGSGAAAPDATDAAAAAAAAAAFWGADCVTDGGLLERAYCRLGVPRRAWTALKRLPEVGGLARAERGAVLDIVATHLASLDAVLPTARAGGGVGAPVPDNEPPPLPPPPPPVPTPPSPCAAGPAADDADSDLETDIAVSRATAAAEAASRGGSAGGRRTDGGSVSVREAMSAALGASLGASTDPPPLIDVEAGHLVARRAEAGGGAPAVDLLTGGELPRLPRAKPPPPPPKKRPPPSPKALAAMMELLEGCLQGGGDSVPPSATPTTPLPRPPRWYDARSRVALRRVAHWLNVPWAKVAAFERLLTHACAHGGPSPLPASASAPSLSTAPAAAPPASAWDKSVKAAAVAGTALGAGALFAVTGGLAAPAVAAGVASAISALGGASAAASAAAASAFLTTSAGTALVAGGVGAGGGAFAAGRMARRVGDVREFGFVPLADADDAAEAAARLPRPRSTSKLVEGRAGRGESASPPRAVAPPPPPPPPRPPPRPVAVDRDDHPLAPTFRPPSPPRMDRGLPQRASSERFPHGASPERDPDAFPLLPFPASPARAADDGRLAATVCVAGWARCRSDYLDVWKAASPPRDAEPFALVWESDALIALSRAIGAWVRNQATQEAIKLALQHWLYTGVAAAAAGPLALVSVSQAIDSGWSVALDRAVKAGRLLAHTLLARGAGGRPVTLCGYSMGARLIFHCLLELARCGAGASVVEAALLLGTPVTAKPERWALARRAVAGRLVNGYARNDWVLGVIFRASSGLVNPAGGLCPVQVPGIENLNLTALIKGHLQYEERLGEILELVGLAE